MQLRLTRNSIHAAFNSRIWRAVVYLEPVGVRCQESVRQRRSFGLDQWLSSCCGRIAVGSVEQSASCGGAGG